MLVTKLNIVPQISRSSPVRLRQCGHIYTIVARTVNRSVKSVTKIDKDHYCDLSSGEVKEINHQQSRADNLRTVRQSLSRLRDLINCNSDDPSACRWLTLTYRENMTDTKRLYADKDRFLKKLRRRYGSFEFIDAIEPQGRGAWHIHMLLIFPTVAPFMENSEVARLWGQGFVNIKAVSDCDNFGAYLSAYLCDMEVDQDNVSCDTTLKKVPDQDGNVSFKAFAKGMRLSLYPAGVNIFHHSRGIKEPIETFTTYEKAKEKAGLTLPTFSRAVSLSSVDGHFSDTIIYEQYNTKRLKSQ